MASSQAPLVSVIVPVYNDAVRFIKCAEALSSQSYGSDDYEIIIVDNGSTDNLDSVLSQYSHFVTVGESRRSSYAARNAGLKFARCEVIAFTDSDCIPTRDWLERGVAMATETPNCGLVGGRIEMIERTNGKPNWIELFDLTVGFRQQRFIELGHFSVTANLFTFRSVFENVGLFREDFRSGGGDQEWGQRVHRAGYAVVYANDVVIQHPAKSSVRQLVQKAREYAAGSYLLHQSNPSAFAKSLAKDLLPLQPAKLILSTNSRAQGFVQRIMVICVLLLFRYVRVTEKIRLLLGGKPI